MQRYYMILSGDGCPQSGKIANLAEARRERKEMIQFDEDEFGVHEGEIEYYIEKYIETDDTIYHERVK